MVGNFLNKRLINWLLIAFLFVSILPLTGCTVPLIDKTVCLPSWVPFLGGQCDQSSTEEITLTYWGLWEAPEVIQPLIDRYQALHPNVTIEYQQREMKDYFETLRARVATELTPDIVRVHNTWVPYLKDSLAPLPPEVLDSKTYEQIFYPVTKETLLFKGEYYAIPLEVDGLALLYNKALFTQAGITTPPRTWDQFKIVVNNLTKTDESGKIIQAGAAMGYTEGIEHFPEILGLIMAQNGVAFVDSKGKVAFHESITELQENLGVDALEFYKVFSTSRKSWNAEWDSALSAFAQGKLAMFFAPSFRIFDILGQNPKLSFGVAPVPQLSDEEGANQVAWGTFWVEVVPKKSPYQKEAWSFLKFLTEKENLAEMYRLADARRAFGEPYSRRDMAKELEDHQYLGAYIRQAPYYTSWNLVDATYDVYLNDRIKAVFATVIEGSDIASGLDSAASEVQKILDSFK